MTLSEKSDSSTLADDVLALVNQMLDAGGLAEQSGYHLSDQQLDFSRRSALVLCGYDAANQKASIGMLEAATGLGKTLGYLTALLAYAAVSGERCAISTHSRQLQRQMLEKDAARVQEWVHTLTGQWLTVTRRIGKQNFVSKSKVAFMLGRIPEKQETTEMVSFLAELADWLPEGSGVLDDFTQESGRELPDGIMRSQVTLDQHASADDAEQYTAQVVESRQSDVLVINHSLLILHAFRWGSILDDPQEGRIMRSVVVDEAHKLPGIAESVLSDSLSLVRFSRVASSLADRLPGGAWEDLSDMADDFRLFLYEQHGSAMARHVTASHVDDIEPRLASLARCADKASKGLISLCHAGVPGGAKNGEQELYAEALNHCYDTLRIQSAMENSGAGTPIVSWSPVREYPSLSIGTPDAGHTLSRLWAPLSPNDDAQADEVLPPRPTLNSILLTSATLGPPGDGLPEAFDNLSRQLGIIRHAGKDGTPVHHVRTDLMARYAPASFGDMSFVLADPGLPSPTKKVIRDGEPTVETNPTWLAYSADMLWEASRGGERVLALTVSWRDTRALASRLAKLDAALNIIEHQRGEPLKSALTRFEAASDAILITPSGWEGVDAPGLVKNLMIHRVPFTPPNTDVDHRLTLHLRHIGYDAKTTQRILFQRSRESVRQRLAQGLGRGIRAHTDSCKVWIADPRFPVPKAWINSFDPELDDRMTTMLARKPDQRLRDAIPSRFMEAFASSSIWLEDKRLYMPEGL